MKPDRLGPALVLAAAILAPLSVAQGAGRAASPAGGPAPEEPVLITADQITHDRDLNTVSAIGHVEIDQGDITLLADSLSYNLKQDVIVASGNVSLTESSGEVSFADYMELTGDMKRAAARGIRILLMDDSRLAAASGQRVAGNRNILNKAVYTACQPCAEHPDRTPLWDVKADRVTHDETRHVIEYEDAWIDVLGTPVAYVPYLEHADPTIRRKSGLLAPTFINNKLLGFGVRVPYFQVINEHQDLTLSPLYTGGEGSQLAAMHRWRGFTGEAKTIASVAELPTTDGLYEKGAVGWHVDSRGEVDLNDRWRLGWQIERASDRDYLRTYNYRVTDPYLISHPYLEGFGYRSYASLEAYSFQSLSDTEPVSQTANTQSKQPVVFPLATYSYVSAPGNHGDYWSFDSHIASVNRTQGTSSRRVNTLTAWHLPYTAPSGELYTLTTSLRADAYNSDHLTVDQPSQANAARSIPEVSMEWRYPFARVDSTSSQTISPITVATLSPYGGNTSRIPNEDSLDFELDDVNIFSPTPFTGYDRVLTGPHVAYGLEHTYVYRGIGALDSVVGQMYQVHPSSIFLPGTGVDDHVSDIVGRTTVAPSSNFNVSYRYRLNHSDGSIRRSEVDATIGPAPLRVTTSYTFFAQPNPASAYGMREQISTTISSRISQYWSTQLYTVQNVGPDAGNLLTSLALSYEDECLKVTGEVGRRDTTVKTVTSGDYMVVRFVLKTLTEFPVSIF